MQIYRVTFIHKDNGFDLGLFADIDSAKAAIKNARQLPGFSKIPNNVLILPYSVIGEQTDVRVVYDTSVYCHDTCFDYEHCYYLGVFGNRKDAEAAISAFTVLNPWVNDADYETEVYSIDRELGRVEWREGFATDGRG